MPDYLNLRLNKEALGDAERYADSIGYSMPQFIGECVKAVTQMIEADDRRVPLIVSLVDTAGAVSPSLNSTETPTPPKSRISPPASKARKKAGKRKDPGSVQGSSEQGKS